MKKYIIGFSIVSIVVLCGIMAQAQKSQEKKKVAYKGKTYLGQYSNGKISKRLFDSLISYPPVSRDSLNREHPVVQFVFNYAERGVYEDSTGKPRIMADYYSIESTAGKLPEGWAKNLREHTKEGDTAMFFDVLSTYQDSQRTRYHSEPLRLIITE